MEDLASELEKIGKIRFTKLLNDFVWVAFMDATKALEAAQRGSFQVSTRVGLRGFLLRPVGKLLNFSHHRCAGIIWLCN